MSRFAKVFFAGLIAISAILSAPAFAQQKKLEIYSNGAWSINGTLTFTGPVTVTIAGIPIPCTATFTVVITNGVGKITAASFSGSTACAGLNAGGLPWPLSSPSAISGSTSISTTITGISFSSTQPSAVCSNGTANATLTNANPNSGPANNNFTYTATFPSPTSCTNARSTNNMVSSKPVRAI